MANWRDIKDVATHGAALDQKRAMPIRLMIVGADGRSTDELRRMTAPLTFRAVVERAATGEDVEARGSEVDLAIVACETLSPGLDDAVGALRARGVRFLALRPSVESGLARLSDESVRTLGLGEPVGIDFGADAASDQFFEALIGRLPEKKLALCANFEGARTHAAKEVINHTAWQNALIAGVVIIPGADMPILTGNQVKMVLELAAIYGKEMTLARAKELIAVVGAGYTLRTVARELLDLIPGPGWPMKAAIAYGGTVAMGKAAQQYMLRGDEWTASAREKLKALSGRRAEQ